VAISPSLQGAGVFHVVASTLGNPADLSPRAVRTLSEADLIFAEDTRTAHRLLESHGLDRPLRSCFDANEAERAGELAALLRAGKNVALISEAGTPAVSDPGYRLIRSAIDAGARVVPVPGPSALLAALVASGLPTDRFLFMGFPPRKPAARRSAFETFAQLPATLILYESPHRVGETLTDLAAVLGADRPACVARELTKTHEELVRAPLGELAARYATDRPLGEVTLVVAGAPEPDQTTAADDPQLAIRATRLLAAGYTPRATADILTAETALPRRLIYPMVLRVGGAKEPDSEES
jgi:16S rRNA (cytidine1402-2'-O)-methyltransferase